MTTLCMYITSPGPEQFGRRSAPDWVTSICTARIHTSPLTGYHSRTSSETMQGVYVGHVENEARENQVACNGDHETHAAPVGQPSFNISVYLGVVWESAYYGDDGVQGTIYQ